VHYVRWHFLHNEINNAYLAINVTKRHYKITRKLTYTLKFKTKHIDTFNKCEAVTKRDLLLIVNSNYNNTIIITCDCDSKRQLQLELEFKSIVDCRTDRI